jgi:hypothetical protein
VEVQKGSVSMCSRQFHDAMAKVGLVPKRMHRKRQDKVEPSATCPTSPSTANKFPTRHANRILHRSRYRKAAQF